MTNRLLCIYHAHCDDGFGAAWSVRHAFNTHAELLVGYTGVDFYPAIHSGKVPDVFGRDVVMVDFVYPARIMAKLLAEAKSMLVLDHHKSSMLDMMAWAKNTPIIVARQNEDKQVTIQMPNGQGRLFFDMTRSGAMMAWDHFHPTEKPPHFIEYIQDHDLWTKKLPKIDEFTAALRSYPMEFEVWDEFEVWKTFDKLLVDGAHILRYKRQLVDIAVKNSFWVELKVPVSASVPAEGHGVIAGSMTSVIETDMLIRIRGANVMPAISSEVGEALALRYGGKSLTWIEGFKWTYGLRSRAVGDQPAPDVSLIATAMGGGGHHQAAGFKTAGPVHTKWRAPDAESEEES